MKQARRPLLTGLSAEHETDSRHHHLESGVCQRQLLCQQPAATSWTSDLTSKAHFLAGRTCKGVPARAYLQGLHFDHRPRSLNRERPMQLQGAAYFPES
jgi:hypothetical protein